jgi:L-ascorbate metabolism protein UlaG (beta-lactamase superfamily)
VGEETVIDEVMVKTFPAYNRRGFPHPRSKDWVGYLLSFDGFRVYHGGDTDSWAELVGMRPDLAFLPIAGFVSFGVKAGVEAARGLGATITVPMHYGLLPWTGKNGEKFLQAYPGESALLRNALKG